MGRERGGQGPSCPSALERAELKGARLTPDTSEQGKRSGAPRLPPRRRPHRNFL